MKILIIVLLSILISFSCWDREIRENRIDTTGRIIKKLNSAKGGYVLIYEYKVTDSIFERMYPIKIYTCNFEKTFQGKYFPVVYSTINPEKSIMLITPNDFITWGYEFPDSLNWVKKCLK